MGAAAAMAGLVGAGVDVAGVAVAGVFPRDAVVAVDDDGASLRRRPNPPFHERGAPDEIFSGADARPSGVGGDTVTGAGSARLCLSRLRVRLRSQFNVRLTMWS